MERNSHIQNELNELSKVLSNIPFVPTYTVPKGYFNTITNTIILLSQKNNTYTIPPQYFDTLSNSIVTKIKNETNELTDVAPTLASLAKVNVYSTPTTYFNTIQVPNRTTAKVVSIQPQQRRPTWLRYAVAACAVGIISITAVNLLQTKTIAKEDQIIAGTNLTYKQIQSINIDTAFTNITTEEMDNYLCANGVIDCNKLPDTELQQDLENLNISDDDLDALLGEKTN